MGNLMIGNVYPQYLGWVDKIYCGSELCWPSKKRLSTTLIMNFDDPRDPDGGIHWNTAIEITDDMEPGTYTWDGYAFEVFYSADTNHLCFRPLMKVFASIEETHSVNAEGEEFVYPDIATVAIPLEDIRDHEGYEGNAYTLTWEGFFIDGIERTSVGGPYAGPITYSSSDYIELRWALGKWDPDESTAYVLTNWTPFMITDISLTPQILMKLVPRIGDTATFYGKAGASDTKVVATRNADSTITCKLIYNNNEYDLGTLGGSGLCGDKTFAELGIYSVPDGSGNVVVAVPRDFKYYSSIDGTSIAYSFVTGFNPKEWATTASDGDAYTLDPILLNPKATDIPESQIMHWYQFRWDGIYLYCGWDYGTRVLKTGKQKNSKNPDDYDYIFNQRISEIGVKYPLIKDLPTLIVAGEGVDKYDRAAVDVNTLVL